MSEVKKVVEKIWILVQKIQASKNSSKEMVLLYQNTAKTIMFPAESTVGKLYTMPIETFSTHCWLSSSTRPIMYVLQLWSMRISVGSSFDQIIYSFIWSSFFCYIPLSLNISNTVHCQIALIPNFVIYYFSDGVVEVIFNE